MTQPDAIEELTRTLRADLDAVWQQILDEQQRLIDRWGTLAPPQRVHQLMLVQAHIRALADSADALAARSVAGMTKTAYETGAWGTAIAAGSSAAFGAPDLDAITHLARDTMENLLTATNGVRESTKTLVRTLTRDHVRSKLYTGKTAEQVARELSRAIEHEGVTAIVYRNGARVGLGDYADMVVRTKTAEAYQEGGFQQGRALGIEWWEIFDGAGCGLDGHEDPQKANGLIVASETAERYPISHPRCTRVTSPRPDIRTASDAGRAAPTRAAELVRIQEAAEKARASATAPLVARARRASVRVSRATNLRAGTAVSAAAQRHQRLAPPA